jgi:serpin B
MRRIIALATIALATTLAPPISIMADTISGADHIASAQPQIKADVVSANNQMGFNLFAEAIKQSSGKNVVVSPLSVSLALAMTANGAAKDTADAMLSVLGERGQSMSLVNESNKALIHSLSVSGGQISLDIADALWANKNVTFKDPFLKDDEKFYGAKLSSLDFASPDTVTTINKWACDKTKGKICSIVDRLGSDEILVLTNAIYFKGDWSNPFDKALTQSAPFTLLDNSTKTLPLMSRGGEFNYLKGEDFQAVELPYGDKHVSMFVFLPNKGVDFQAFQAKFNQQNWNSWLAGFTGSAGDLKLPHFKVNYDAELKDMLSAMGMGIAFDKDKADFSKMCDVPAYIGKVKHKTLLEVDEKGTVAAATTTVHMMMKAIYHAPSERFSMVVDHPFVVAIKDNTTGSVLFLGSITAPE